MWQGERHIERYRPFAGSLHTQLQRPGLGQVQGSSLELNLGFPLLGFYYFPRALAGTGSEVQQLGPERCSYWIGASA